MVIAKVLGIPLAIWVHFAVYPMDHGKDFQVFAHAKTYRHADPRMD
jgi:hypothetical protein